MFMKSMYHVKNVIFAMPITSCRQIHRALTTQSIPFHCRWKV